MKKQKAKTKTKAVKPATPAPAAVPRHKHKGLGKGLGALIGTPAPVAPAPTAPVTATPAATPVAAPAPMPVEQSIALNKDAILHVAVGNIQRSPWQPRQTFDEEALAELTESIKTHGIINPLLCRRAGASYELIGGERRLRAAINAQLSQVPIILVDAEDRKAAELAIIENIQRQDLNVIEEAEGYRTLAEKFSLTQQDVAERVGKSRSGVTNALRLLDLPDEVKQLVADGRLSTGHAKVLLGLTDPEEQIVLARKCITEALSVRVLERLLEKRKAQPEPKASTSRPDMPHAHVQDLSDRLHRYFGTAIRLTSGVTHANGKRGKGCLEIDFYDNADLDRILILLGIELD